MSVQSARVQEVVKGDDVTLKHQIMKDMAFNAELSRAPVTVDTGDVTRAFYPQQNQPDDSIGYLASPIGTLPSSLISVSIPGDIPAVGLVPERGTKMFQSGSGRTVRIEIVRNLTGFKETYYLIDEVDVFERGFPASLDDTSGGINPPAPNLNLP